MESDPFVPLLPAPASTETRYSTSGARFIVLEPIRDPVSLRRMADFLERRAASSPSEADAVRLRSVAVRLRQRSL